MRSFFVYRYQIIRDQRVPLAKLASTLAERDDNVRIVGAERVLAQLPALANVSRKVKMFSFLFLLPQLFL